MSKLNKFDNLMLHATAQWSPIKYLARQAVTVTESARKRAHDLVGWQSRHNWLLITANIIGNLGQNRFKNLGCCMTVLFFYNIFGHCKLRHEQSSEQTDVIVPWLPQQGRLLTATELAPTIHFLEHSIHIFQVVMVKKPNFGISLIFIKWNCNQEDNSSSLTKLNIQHSSFHMHSTTKAVSKICKQMPPHWIRNKKVFSSCLIKAHLFLPTLTGWPNNLQL